MIRPLPDGTHLTWITDRRSADRLAKWQQRGRRSAPPALTALTLRVISYQITATHMDGTSQASTVRLVTTLLDPQRYPAAELAALYHQRWEIETAFYGLKVTLRGPDRVLRSRTLTASSRNSSPCWRSTRPAAKPSPKPPPAPTSTPTGSP